jgi:hypothetical protein
MHAERVPVGLVIGAAIVAGAFAIPARSAPPLPPAITIVEPNPADDESVIQHVTVETCPIEIVEHVKPVGHATCVRGQFAKPGYFIHVAYYTTEWWEHVGVVDDNGKTMVAFIDRPSLSGDPKLRLRAGDIDGDGIDEVIATYDRDRAVEVFGVKGDVTTLARVDAIDPR